MVHWLAQCEVRKPVCIACQKGFADDDGGFRIGAWLFAKSPLIARATSTSAFCADCWRTLPMDQIETIVTRVLRRLLPRGVLEPMP